MILSAKSIRLAGLSLLLAAQSYAAKLPEFPKPNPIQAFAEFKVFGTNGSPIRIPIEDWPGAKQQARQQSRLAGVGRPTSASTGGLDGKTEG